jgi:hypothetical protein
VKVLRSTVPLRGEIVVVYKPLLPIKRLFVSARANGDWLIIANHDAYGLLGPLLMAAAVSKKAIVWIPGCKELPWTEDYGYEPCDLVLSHHSLQLRPAHWKQMRAMARSWEQVSLHVPLSVVDYSDWPTYRKSGLNSRRNEMVDLALHSRTVFLSSSEPTLRGLATEAKFMETESREWDYAKIRNLARKVRHGEDCDDLTIVYRSDDLWGRE